MAGSRPSVPPPPRISNSRGAPLPRLPRPREESVIEEIDIEALFEEQEAVEEIELGESAILAIELPPTPHRPSGIEPVEASDPALDVLSRPAPPVRISPLAASAPAPTPSPTPAPTEVLAQPAAPCPAAKETVRDPSPSISASPSPAPTTVGPRPEPRKPRRQLEMSDVEALSTIDLRPSFDACDSGPYPFDTATAMRRLRVSPARVGVLAAAATAVLVAVTHLWMTAGGGAAPEIASERPVEVIHAAAVFYEADDAVVVPDQQRAREPVVDNERARKLGTLGLRALDEGRNTTAKRLLDKALAANPRSRLALAGLGRYYLAKRNHKRAVHYLQRAVKIEPRKADNQRFLADAYAGLGSLGKARRHYERAATEGDAIAKQRLAEL